MTPNSEPLAGIEHAAWCRIRPGSTARCRARSRLWNGFSSPTSHARIERVGAQAREDAKRAVRRGRALLVVDDEAQRLPVGQRAGAALDRLAPRGRASSAVEAEVEADLAIARPGTSRRRRGRRPSRAAQRWRGWRHSRTSRCAPADGKTSAANTVRAGFSGLVKRTDRSGRPMDHRSIAARQYGRTSSAPRCVDACCDAQRHAAGCPSPRSAGRRTA